MKQHGLDEDFIQSRSSRAASVQMDSEDDENWGRKTTDETFTRQQESVNNSVHHNDEDDYDDDFDATAEKSDRSEEYDE